MATVPDDNKEPSAKERLFGEKPPEASPSGVPVDFRHPIGAGESQAPEPPDSRSPSGSARERLFGQSATSAPASARERLFPSSDRGNDLLTTAAVGLESDPGLSARVLKLKEATALPEEVIARNADEIERTTKLDNFNWPQFAKSSPIISEWLSESPHRISAAWKDLPALDEAERLVEEHNILSAMGDFFTQGFQGRGKDRLQAPAMDPAGESDLGKALTSGLYQTAAGMARIPGLLVEFSNYQQNNVNRLLRDFGVDAPPIHAPDWLLNNPAAKHFDEMAKRYKTEDQTESIVENVAAHRWERAGKIAAIQVAANAPNMAMTIGLALAGLPTAAAAQMGLTTAANRLSEAQKEAGELEDPNAALQDAINHGAAEALFERMMRSPTSSGKPRP
jgi:hypothetical protein